MSAGRDLTNFVKENGGQLISNLYTDLIQPSAKNIGKTLGSVVELMTLFQVPMQYLNEKIKLKYTKRLEEYAKKLEGIPEEKRCEVNPQVGVPIMEKLGYITNDEIADLFTNLLTKASSVDTVNLAHPSFVQLIERLSVDEARIIRFLADKDHILSLSIKITVSDKGDFLEPMRNKTLIPDMIGLDFPDNENVYLDNLVSMGILDISEGKHISNEDLYNPLLEKYSMRKAVGFGIKKVEYPKSFYQITNLGKAFIKACNNIDNTNDQSVMHFEFAL
ncbi:MULTISPECIES: DUF4393 domain-containing protein [Capnocytophaga]|uniref:DUF4393 domain-containing protein n=1 Tax=Capnocytophaga TaxID=1016 RepID=UPI000BB1E78A|nr:MULTISPECIES: DUF4393 domain-containing protein [Capnocytophaga]ATA75578.1 hypothetical protein CGC52_09220 [Capnocytophaga sp. H2931]MDO4764270.1 DUF4393 domain-containing protein [Flavobacteriaceae bacterium]